MKKISILLASLCLSATGLTFATNTYSTPTVESAPPCGESCSVQDNCRVLGPGPHFNKNNDARISGEKWKAKFAERNKQLHDKLDLTAAQEKNWEEYLASFEKMKPLEKDRPLPPEEFEKLSAPARMEKMFDHMKIRQAQLEAHLDAVKKFYASLTDDQKKIFDQESMPRPFFGFKGPRAHPPKK